MREIDRYLANLIIARLNGKKPEALPQGISVAEIIDIASRSQMKNLLLGSLSNVSNISDEERNMLVNLAFSSIIRTSKQLGTIKELEKWFEEEHITNQPLKGSVMKYIYPSPEMREMGDIDILIAEEDMDRAAEVLTAHNFKLKESIKHHDIYVNDANIVIEAHRAMYDKTVDKNQYGYFENFSRTTPKENCKYTQVFSNEDFYVYMMAHMAKHFYQTGCGIRHLVDIYVYLNKYGESLDREYVDRELEKCKILTFTKHMEILAFNWLRGRETEKVYDDIFRYMLDAGIYGKDENGIWNKFAEEKESGNKVTVGKLRRWYYFPPLYYMSEYYPYLERKPWLLGWAWFVRGINGLINRKGTRKRKMIDEIDDESIKRFKSIYKTVDLKFKS